MDERKITVKITEEECVAAQRVWFLKNGFNENLDFIRQRPEQYDAKYLAEYTAKKAEADAEFERVLNEIGRKHIPAALIGSNRSTSWKVDFNQIALDVSVAGKEDVAIFDSVKFDNVI